jgi:hypothetical protein
MNRTKSVVNFVISKSLVQLLFTFGCIGKRMTVDTVAAHTCTISTIVGHGRTWSQQIPLPLETIQQGYNELGHHTHIVLRTQLGDSARLNAAKRVFAVY